uniref:Col_cuticle_N domain-containing protein n=1 Tax=Globodera pallida TaxID=36090 RepID=A0A183C4R7_GLOPA
MENCGDLPKSCLMAAAIFSTISFAALLIGVPLMLNDVATLQFELAQQQKIYKEMSNNMWHDVMGQGEMIRMERANANVRSRRQYDHFLNDGDITGGNCAQGPQGASGTPGEPGQDGTAGVPGAPGQPGMALPPLNELAPAPAAASAYKLEEATAGAGTNAGGVTVPAVVITVAHSLTSRLDRLDHQAIRESVALAARKGPKENLVHQGVMDCLEMRVQKGKSDIKVTLVKPGLKDHRARTALGIPAVCPVRRARLAHRGRLVMKVRPVNVAMMRSLASPESLALKDHRASRAKTVFLERRDHLEPKANDHFLNDGDNCAQGPQGASGTPGEPGQDGTAGAPGAPGQPGVALPPLNELAPATASAYKLEEATAGAGTNAGGVTVPAVVITVAHSLTSRLDRLDHQAIRESVALAARKGPKENLVHQGVMDCLEMRVQKGKSDIKVTLVKPGLKDHRARTALGIPAVCPVRRARLAHRGRLVMKVRPVNVAMMRSLASPESQAHKDHRASRAKTVFLERRDHLEPKEPTRNIVLAQNGRMVSHRNMLGPANLKVQLLFQLVELEVIHTLKPLLFLRDTKAIIPIAR